MSSDGRGRKRLAGNRRRSSFTLLASLGSRPRLRNHLDRIDNRLIAGATAVISGKMRPDRLAIWRGVQRQQLLRSQQHAWRAIAALERIALDKRLLQIVDL